MNNLDLNVTFFYHSGDKGYLTLNAIFEKAITLNEEHHYVVAINYNTVKI